MKTHDNHFAHSLAGTVGFDFLGEELGHDVDKALGMALRAGAAKKGSRLTRLTNFGVQPLAFRKAGGDAVVRRRKAGGKLLQVGWSSVGSGFCCEFKGLAHGGFQIGNLRLCQGRELRQPALGFGKAAVLLQAQTNKQVRRPVGQVHNPTHPSSCLVVVSEELDFSRRLMFTRCRRFGTGVPM
jgi:hypothetical protein